MVNMLKATIFDIKRFAIHDGPGIRTTVFFKGCPAECWWCHNPEARKKTDNDRQVSVEQLVAELEKDVIFYDTSGGGVTFSGGEPLMQHEFLKEVLNECSKRYIHTALDTSGYALKKVFDSVIDKVDLFLYDLKLMDDEKHMKYVGVSNRLILENLEALAEKGRETWIRFPVIPGITNTQENIYKVREFASSLNSINKIDLLPYHRIGESKYEKLGLENKMKGIAPLSDKEMNELKKYFEDYEFKVKIGG